MAGLMLGDVMACAAVFLLFRVRGSHDEIILYFGLKLIPVGARMDVFGVLFLGFILVRYVAGDYNRRTPFWDNTRLTTRALIIAGSIETLILLSSGHSKSVIGILASWGALVVLVPLGRQFMRLLMSWGGLWQLPTAVLANGELGREAYLNLRHKLSLGYDFRIFIAANSGEETPEAFGALSRIEQSPELVDQLRASGCLQVIVALDNEPSPEMAKLVDQLTAADIFCTVIPRFAQVPLYGLTVNYLFGEELLLLNYRNNLGRMPQRAVKRSFDLAGSILLLALLSPAILLIAAAIKLEDGGPLLYRHQRVGRDGKFDCYKFRTMRVDAPAQLSELLTRDPDARAEWESDFKLRNDPRITRVGRFLRRNSLDELPQLLNVIKGEMSLVGPRPIVADEMSRYGDELLSYKRVRPGITGLWQISGRNDVSYRRRIALDVWYIRNWSLWYDVVILLKTLVVVFRGRGAY
jgi:undecaprenyl-phosphate galactose phosphotransferase